MNNFLNFNFQNLEPIFSFYKIQYLDLGVVWFQHLNWNGVCFNWNVAKHATRNPSLNIIYFKNEYAILLTHFLELSIESFHLS